MTQLLPSHDHLDDCMRKRLDREAGDLNLHKKKLTEVLCNRARKRPYKVTYKFDSRECPAAPNALKKALRDWVNEQPGYRARLDLTQPYWLIVKVLGEKKSRRWPFFLRWIPGLGG